MKDWDLQTLFDRGMLDDAIVRDELFDDIANGKRLTIYQGLDPTSPNMHIGHLVGLRVLRWFQLHGHHVILLIGDFTGRIGDPSDRPEARKRLTHAQVLANAETYAEQFSKIFDLDGDNPADIKFNGHWLDNISLAQFVEIMDKFTVQQLLERSMFQQRLKNNEALYLNEMIYPILQGYDSVAMEVDAELGGSDQLFNMMRGRDLVDAYLGKTKHVLTTQLLEGLDGRKMSKTYGNTVDLNEDPVPMFFKLTLVQDSKLPRFMQVLTDRAEDEIAAIEERAKTEHNMIDARRLFAHDIVTMLHSVGSRRRGPARVRARRQRGRASLRHSRPPRPARHPPRRRRRGRRSSGPQRPRTEQKRRPPPRSARRHPHQRRDGQRPARVDCGIETRRRGGEDRQTRLRASKDRVGHENPLSRRGRGLG